MDPTAVCGIVHNQDLNLTSNVLLELLLSQFGRNGPESAMQAEKKAQIEQILQSRRDSGVVISDVA